jgi:hypothetical protein
MGKTLSSASRLQCPHGGQVTIVSTSQAKAGAALATTADIFTIAGCAFQLPGPTPSPCVRVQWLVPDLVVKCGGNPTVSDSSVGLCLAATGAPQGTVAVVQTQGTVTSS